MAPCCRSSFHNHHWGPGCTFRPGIFSSAAALGCYPSKLFNKTPHFRAAHYQVLSRHLATTSSHEDGRHNQTYTTPKYPLTLRRPGATPLKAAPSSPLRLLPGPTALAAAKAYQTRFLATVRVTRCFHASSYNCSPPLIALLTGMLKSSTALGAVQTVGRIALSLFPMVWIRRHFLGFLGKLIEMDYATPAFAQHHAKILRMSKGMRYASLTLFLIPVSLLAITLLASSERTPLTGRWRVILLSPAEEEEISNDLQGPKWHSTIRGILTQSSGGREPSIVPYNDWRVVWVEATVRRLEQAVVLLSDSEGYNHSYETALVATQDSPSALLPPPPNFPLIPRSRVASRLHEAVPHSELDHTSSTQTIHRTHHTPPHTHIGPPYSFMIVDKDESNAFSYGFGPGGGGGVVLYSGFLDDILRPPVPPPVPPAQPLTRPASSGSIFSRFLSSSSSSPNPPLPPPVPAYPPIPTPEQTSKLAALLAHELSHLVLSHHLETLSSGTILIPSVLSICIDALRSALFPITWVFGPFAADALDRTLRMSVDDVSKAGESCASRKMEIEADVVSARLLALAGFDPHAAVTFWEERLKAKESQQTPPPESGKILGRFWHRETHPEWEERVLGLKKELESWEVERRRTLARMQRPP